jgi:CHAT domain-containing protein
VNQEERHLSSNEIDRLVEGLPNATEGSPDAALLEVRQHLEVCEACQRLVSMHKDCDRILRRLKQDGPAEHSVECPSEESVYDLVAGILDRDAADKILKHAFRCAHCSALVRLVSEELASEVSPDETNVLAALKTSSRSWQEDFGKRLASLNPSVPEISPAAPISTGRPRFLAARFVPRAYAFTAMAAVMLLIAGLWTYRRFKEPSVDQLLARAYFEHRTMEMRIAGAAQAPLRQERGPASSSLTKSTSLLKAEYEIRIELASRGEDPDVLARKGRAELLEGQYVAAIASLKHALDLNADSPDVLGDLATAYAQRGDAEGQPLDFGEAIEYLGQALRKKPDDAVFLFNRAVVNERLNLFEEASKDWEHYLRIDPKGPWADEARQHLAALQQKLKHSLSIPPAEHDASRAIPLLESRAAGTASDAAMWMESLDEDYFDVAVQEWLPALATGRLQARSSLSQESEWRALLALSRILKSQHTDSWLSELLSAQRSRGLLKGWIALGEAAQLNARGNFDGAAAAASHAAQILLREKCTSGALRALWEQAYALQRGQQGRLCLGRTAEAKKLDPGAAHPWLSAQLEFEESVCLAMVGQLGLAQKGIERGTNIAESAKYGTLLLRGMHLAGVEIAAHDPQRSWAWFERGLQRHWAGSYRPFRAYQFYAEMSFTPENRGEWHLARALMEEAVAHIARTQNHLTEAVARHSLAVDEQLSGRLDEARDEFARASKIFSSLPSTPTTRTFVFSAEVYQAALEAEQGRADLALSTLTAARHDYAEQTQYRIWQHYYEALGTALLKSGGSEAEAERALQSAVAISEAALATLKTDEDRQLWEQSAARSYRALVELEIERKNNKERALELWEWYIASGIRIPDRASRTLEVRFEELDAGPDLPRLTLVAHSLPALRDISVISFARLNDKIVAWMFDDRGVRQATLSVPPAVLSQTVKRFLRLCSEPQSDMEEVRRVGRQLYDWLMAPLAQTLVSSRVLVIETDGDIGRMPFNALVTPSGEFLGQDFEIVTSPGLQFSSSLRRVAPLSPWDRILIVGVSGGQASLGLNLPSLPDARVESREISDRFPHSSVLLDEAATLDKVKRELPAVRVFHFAGHAVATRERNGLVFGALGPDAVAQSSQLVSAEEIAKLSMSKLDLVVLSACATGADEGGLADPQSLVRVFLRGGTPQVVASRWSVDSVSTARLMGDFYAGLAQGWSTPLALKKAEEAVRHRPGTMHPYFWASFGVFGRT